MTVRTRSRKGLLTFIVAAAMVLVLGTCGSAEEVDVPPTPTTAPAGQPQAPAPAAPAASAAPAAPAATAVPTPTTITAPAASKYGGTLRLTNYADARTLDPLQSNAYPDWPQMTPLMEGLTRLDSGSNVVPALAESWDATPDAVTFHLRKGVKFHDGTDFNAEAVKFNIDRYFDPQYKSRIANFLKNVASVEVVGDYTLKFNMKGPDVVLLKYMGTPNGGYIQSPTAVQSMSLVENSRKISATAAFKLEEWRSDSSTTYSKFDDYWKEGLPYLDEFVIRIIADPAVAVAAFRAGEIDLLGAPRTIDFLALKDEPGVTAVRKVCQCYGVSLELNFTRGALGDLKVRQAMSMGIDRNALMQALYSGLGRPVYGPISPGFATIFRPELKVNAYNPIEAKRLLAEAGYTDGFDITISTYGQTNRDNSSAISAMWSEIGIRAKVDIVDFGTISFRCQKEWECDIYQTGYGNHLDPDFPMRDRYYPGMPKNIEKKTFPGYKDIMDKAVAEFDPAARAKLLHQAEDLLVENVASIWTISSDLIELWKNYVKGYSPNPANIDYYTETWLYK